MKQKTIVSLYFLLAFLMLIDFYLIFNVGNPNSIVRYIVPTTTWDMALTLAVSACIALLSFVVFKDRKNNPVSNMLLQNRSYILELRAEGKSDSDIADSFVEELNPRRYGKERIRKMVLKFLAEMEP